MNDRQPMNTRGVTRAAIRDVAARAGVSIATVSRVLNGRPDVAAGTRELVLAHARDLGYMSNRNARALAGKRTGLIGLVVPFTRNGYFSEIIEGASDAADERDARLVLFPTHHRRDREARMLDHLVHGATDGSLLVLPLELSRELGELRRLGSPFVVIDPSVPVPGDVPVVSVANWAGGRKATEHLIALGHTRIGTITGYPNWSASIDRLAGYRSALLEAGLPIRPEYTREADFWIQDGQRAAHELLALPDRPTAIFAMSDAMALGTLYAARERGIDVPGDLSVVGFDDVEMASIATPALTTVSQPLQEMGRMAITMLYRQISGLPLEANRIELSTRLVVRASTAPPPRMHHGDTETASGLESTTRLAALQLKGV